MATIGGMKTSDSPVNILVFIAHGSKKDSAKQEVTTLASQLAERLTPARFAAVYPCFLELAKPSLDDCVETLISDYPGQPLQVSVLPYFLCSGMHVDNDLPAKMLEYSHLYPDCTFTLLDYIGKGGALLPFLLDHLVRE